MKVDFIFLNTDVYWNCKYIFWCPTVQSNACELYAHWLHLHISSTVCKVLKANP